MGIVVHSRCLRLHVSHDFPVYPNHICLPSFPSPLLLLLHHVHPFPPLPYNCLHLPRTSPSLHFLTLSLLHSSIPKAWIVLARLWSRIGKMGSSSGRLPVHARLEVTLRILPLSSGTEACSGTELLGRLPHVWLRSFPCRT